MLIGKDIILKDRMPEASVAFRSMLQVSEDYLIAGLRVLQSMVSVYYMQPSICVWPVQTSMCMCEACTN